MATWNPLLAQALQSSTENVPSNTWYPLLVLAIGLVIVIGGIVALRINAFLSLLTAAIVVSLMAPGEWAEKIPRVAESFGSTAAGVGIVIALAAVIGKAMMDSGAADRIVRSALRAFGEERAATAMMASSFTLAIPVFFDTVFYLLVPLARSLHRITRKHYLKYLLAISAAAAAHALVPPTPGPVAVAKELDVDLGLMILIGIAVGAPAAIVSLLLSRWLDHKIEVVPPDEAEQEFPQTVIDESDLPSFSLSLIPVVLPVVLIAGSTIVTNFRGPIVDILGETAVTRLEGLLGVVGNPNMALLISCIIALLTFVGYRRPTKTQFAESVERALMSGGMIILITAAGGAFGAMLKQAQLAPAIQAVFGESAASGLGVLLLAFGMASLLKFAQGSSTAAMIVTAGMFAAILESTTLGYHRVYVGTAIGAGSLVGSWMNDSGFWIFAKMGGLTELQTLKTWTPLLVLLGVVAMAMTLLLATVMPLV